MRAYFAIFGASIALAAACGARSSLEVDEPAPHHHHHDAGPDAHDASPDVEDAGPDVEDAGPDAHDAAPDATVPDCAEAGVTFVYVITAQNHLYSFMPATKQFHLIGTIQCNDPTPGAAPFSMAVDRKGIAYVVFGESGNLYRVSTLTAKCSPTGFVPLQHGFTRTFGMGFSANATDPGETLYVASDFNTGSAGTERLAKIDTTTFALTPVGDFSSPIGNAELTGTGDARLFAFGVEQTAPPILHLAQISKPDAVVVDDTFLVIPGDTQIFGWAFAFYAGDFYFFTAPTGTSSTVSRYHPGDPPVATFFTSLAGETIVGAGVSTCAPQE